MSWLRVFSVFFVLASLSFVTQADQFSKRIGNGQEIGGGGAAMTYSPSSPGYSFLLSGFAAQGLSNGWIVVTEFADDGTLTAETRVSGDFSFSGADIATQIGVSNPEYAVAGYHTRNSPAFEDAFVYAFDNNGDYQWRAGGDYFDQFRAIEAVSDGGYVVAGVDSTINSNSDGGNVLVGRLNSGSFQWLKSYNFFDTQNSLSLHDDTYDITPKYTSAGPVCVHSGWAVVGSTKVIGANRRRGFILFLDMSGNVASFTTIQDTSRNIEFRSIKLIPKAVGCPNEYAIGGLADGDSFFAKYSSGIIWYKSMNIAAGNDRVESIALTSNHIIGDIGGASGITLAKLQKSDGAVTWVKNYQETSGAPRTMGVASDGDLLIPGTWQVPPPSWTRSLMIKTTEDFSGLPANCDIGSPSYSTVTLTLSVTTQNTIVQTPINLSATADNASILDPNVAVVNHCQ